MRRGFIFKDSLCVGCGACRAACILENNWEILPRTVYTYNSEASATLPLINISLACNHCEKPVCLSGCPSGAYSTDILTGAIIIDENKCIGCKYCQWNCPYDAPKFNTEKRVIGKCNLCYTGLAEGRSPACSSGCPTGALTFGQMKENIGLEYFPWFPEKNLNPGIQFETTACTGQPVVIPEDIYGKSDIKPKEKSINPELSLVAFSFLAALSVSEVVASLIKGSFPVPELLFSLVIITAITSLFHLGRKLRAWRAILNFRTSPLSREIILFAAFSVTSVTAVISEHPGLLIIASIIGLLFLITVDCVYLFADSRKKMVFHGGQTFITGLLIISFATGNIIPFVFIALLKAASAIYNIIINTRTGLLFVLRFFRLVILSVSMGILISGNLAGYNLALGFFLTGELFERILFYIDFEPLNINNSMYNHQIFVSNEKKRS